MTQDMIEQFSVQSLVETVKLQCLFPHFLLKSF